MKSANAEMLLAMICVVFLSACTGIADQQGTSEIALTREGPTGLASTSMPILTATSSPVPTPEPTSTLQTPDVSPTPDPIDSPIFGEFLLAPGSDPTCQLPCWQGLQIGESSSSDVQMMFDRAFGFNGNLSTLQDRLPSISASYSNPGLVQLGYYWVISDRELFSLFTLIDPQTDTLQGVRFVMATFGGYDVLPPQALIASLGTPSAIYLYGYPNLTQVLFFYEQLGIVSSPVVGVVIKERIVNQQKQYFGDSCFDTLPESQEDNIVAPFALTDLQSLPPILSSLFGEHLEAFPFATIQEVTGMTLDEIANVAIQDSDPCIQIDYTSFSPTF